MPVWHENLRDLQSEGFIQIVGLIQEQHPERCRLFMQWHEMDWPILVDSLNRTDAKRVPNVYAVDEHGIVRAVKPEVDWIRNTFIGTHYDLPAVFPDEETLADLEVTDTDVQRTAQEWCDQGDSAYLQDHVDAAVFAFRKAVDIAPDRGEFYFRLGVALRTRFDYHGGDVEDFKAASEAWTTALALQPDQYIWRRRLQQFGPRLDKPYNFYFWIEDARKAVLERGEVPSPLVVEPRGSEIAEPMKAMTTADAVTDPDPDNLLPADARYVDLRSLVVPAALEAGKPGRVHVLLTPQDPGQWDNEGEPAQVRLALPEGWQGEFVKVIDNRADEASTAERRVAEFEIIAPAAATGDFKIGVAAYYSVCDHNDGTCMYLRQNNDLEIRVISTPEKSD